MRFLMLWSLALAFLTTMSDGRGERRKSDPLLPAEEKPPAVVFQEGYYLSKSGTAPLVKESVVRVVKQESGAYQFTWATEQPYMGLALAQDEKLTVGMLYGKREAVAVYTYDRTLPGWRGECSAWNILDRWPETLEFLRPLGK